MTINYSNSFITLLANCNCKVSLLLLDCRWCGNEYAKDDSPNCISYRETAGLISFMPNGKAQELTDEGTWVRAGRQSCKPGKIVRMILNDETIERHEINDKEIELFTNCFKAYEKSTNVTFEVVPIAQAYDRSNYFDPPDSCMFNRGFTEFYPDSCTSLVAKTEKGFLGRALLWANCIKQYSGDESIKVMDRIYAPDDVKELFKAWAKENGYHHKQRQSYDNKQGFVSPMGDCITLKLSLLHPTQDNHEGEWPYMDTFTYGDGMALFNYECDDCRTYNDTDGSRTYDGDEEDHDGEVQLSDGTWIDRDDAVDIDGTWYDVDDCCTCHRTDEWILRNDAYRIELSRHETIWIHSRYVTEGSEV